MDVNETELLKLCFSQTINLLNPDHVMMYGQFLPKSKYDEILQACSDIKSTCISLNIPMIDELFDQLHQFQSDQSDSSLLNRFGRSKKI